MLLSSRWISLAGALLAIQAGILHCALLQAALPPQEAQRRFELPPGVDIGLFASEPDIRQPVTMTFDDRGRLWMIQYLQYPNPAGLNAVSVDQYLRTKYERVPPPPPKAPRGADRITIAEDSDGDGQADKFKDFATGLNLASALALGYGGVFVGQAPYLLFYPDRNGDDVPDGDPEVLLEGFGMEDAHAVINSLVWGPDGWLYGAQGSTVTARVRGIEFQQGIWRYHPLTKEFELFAEGGGNTWGLDFDPHGNIIAGTNYGGHVALHQVQGGYYVKGFSKHGPLHNPYTYGYFEHVPHRGWRGEHVTCGGIVYRGAGLPVEFDRAYIAANVMSNTVSWHVLKADRSSFWTEYRGDLVRSDDVCFRPVDCLAGPDGVVYIADWYDQRINHVIPEDTWDKTNGRIWRVSAKGARPTAKFSRASLTVEQLVDLCVGETDWQAREALRILGERRDPAVCDRLRQIIAAGKGDAALRAVWALNACGGFSEKVASKLLHHASPDVRTWSVRLLGDGRKIKVDTARRLAVLARVETSPTVRSQLACTCKRLPGSAAVSIVAELLGHSEDVKDPHIPLLLWWAIEDKALSDRDAVIDLVTDRQRAKLPLVRSVIASRLARRYLDDQSPEGYVGCERLLANAPPDLIAALLEGIDAALAGQRNINVPHALAARLESLFASNRSDVTLLRIVLRLGNQEAAQQALRKIADPRRPLAERLTLLQGVAQMAPADLPQLLLRVLATSDAESLKLAALAALERYADPQIGRTVADHACEWRGELETRALRLLASRPAWSRMLMNVLDQDRIAQSRITIDLVRRMLLHKDAELTARIEKRWGKVRETTAGEKQAMIAHYRNTLSQQRGSAKTGHGVFAKHCGTCHTLRGEGEKIGPDLTSVNRRDREFLLLNIVDPSATIRPEFVAQTVELSDGRVLTGMIVESDTRQIKLVDASRQQTTLVRDEIEVLQPAKQSLMPENLLGTLTPVQLCDLFAYLQIEEESGKPVAGSR